MTAPSPPVRTATAAADRDISALGALAAAGCHPTPEYVTLRLRVREAQAEVEAALAAMRPAAVAPGPLPLPAAALPWDGPLLAQLFRRVVPLATADSPLAAEVLAAESHAADEAVAELLLRVVQGGGAPAGRDGGPAAHEAALHSLAEWLAVPFYREARLRHAPPNPLSAVPRVPGVGTSCPVCGAPPAVGRLRRDDGRLLLWCARCDGEWLHPRMRCPSCGTEDQDALSVIHLDNDDLRWLLACGRCHGYLKCFDERRIPGREPVSLLAEEVQGLVLDAYAASEGLKPAGTFPPPDSLPAD